MSHKWLCLFIDSASPIPTRQSFKFNFNRNLYLAKCSRPRVRGDDKCFAFHSMRCGKDSLASVLDSFPRKKSVVEAGERKQLSNLIQNDVYRLSVYRNSFLVPNWIDSGEKLEFCLTLLAKERDEFIFEVICLVSTCKLRPRQQTILLRAHFSKLVEFQKQKIFEPMCRLYSMKIIFGFNHIAERSSMLENYFIILIDKWCLLIQRLKSSVYRFTGTPSCELKF